MTDREQKYYFFGLLVTGKGERQYLPPLFRSLMATRICTFEVIRLINQRSPRHSRIGILVNMLEAYYFADAAAVNAVLGTSLTDYSGDVETITHPKNQLKKEVHKSQIALGLNPRLKAKVR